jgi:glycosyltransferase involved in cell wall biosynthesis
MSNDVVFFFRTKGYGFSIERVFQDVVEALPREINRREFYCAYRSAANPLAMGWNLWTAALARGSVNHITGDVQYLALVGAGRRTILTIHDCNHLSNLTSLKQAIFYWLWWRWPVARARFVTVISEYTRRDLVRVLGRDPGNLVVIPDPVSPAFTSAPKIFPEQAPRILHLGTKLNKNLPRVAAALKGISCHLRIVGRMDETQKRALAENQVNYSAVEELDDAALVQEYRDADLVLFASTFEGFGLPIVEAQATGRPVVTSNAASMPEVAGEGACLVDPFDSESIRAGVMRVIQQADYRASLIERGLANVRRFESHRIARQYLDLYEIIWAENRGKDGNKRSKPR